jgi:hypothetical protein
VIASYYEAKSSASQDEINFGKGSRKRNLIVQSVGFTELMCLTATHLCLGKLRNHSIER